MTIDPTTNIECTDPQLVYEWVKTGHWNRSMFMKWLLVVKTNEFCNGAEFKRLSEKFNKESKHGAYGISNPEIYKG